ncbi:MAG: transporter, partial [Deltaproteobacteria bacterium]
VLPQIGGAPAVWTAAMLFFQTVLIMGYLYAHLMNRYVPIKVQLLIHGVLWALALLFLPLAVPALGGIVEGTNAVGQTLAIFAVGVGVPFAFLSANAPLIQAWYAKSGRADAHDPYYLYGASNLGSLIALLGFPLLAEPLLGAMAISRMWSIGFVVLGLMLALAGLMAARGQVATVQPESIQPAENPDSHAPRAVQIAMWIVLSFLPSSMMLAVTTKVSTDMGAVPLLWVIPLSLYLVTFILTFRRKELLPARATEVLALIALIGLAVLFSAITAGHLSPMRAALMVLGFFFVAYYFHARLYALRPSGRHLTLFYVIMSVGGALGGVFNSILAPVIFDGLYEGLMTTAAGLILVFANRLNFAPDRQLKALFTGIIVVFVLSVAIAQMSGASLLRISLLFAGGALIVIALLRKTPQLALIVAPIAIFAATQQLVDHPIFRDRSFFGTHVVLERDGFRLYANGTTIHGAERIRDLTRDEIEPLFYYHVNGPLAQLMHSSIGEKAKSVGIVGL